MPQVPRASWRGVRDRILLSSAELDDLRREAEARGREAWDNATRTGSNIVARTQKELQALGARVLDSDHRPARAGGAPARPVRIASAQPAPLPPARNETNGASGWRRIADPINAGIEGATDAITFGLGDKYEAAKFALGGLVEGDDVPKRYRAVRRFQDAEGDYARKYHPIARAVGGTIGTVGSIAATGGVSAPARAAPYVARISGQLVRDAVAHVAPHLAVAGASAGVTGQVASDVLSRRFSDAGTYGDAAIGGALGATATRYVGPRAGAAVEAYASEGSRGLRTGQASLENAQTNAILGAHLGRIGDVAGQNWAQGLTSHKKGKLGRADVGH